MPKIPCGINFEEWFPENKNNSKEIFSLDRNKKIILFLAMGGNNPRKGLDTLAKSLKLVKQEFQLVIAGDQFPTILKATEFKFIDYPKDKDIPQDPSTFSIEAQQALVIMNALPDIWEGMNGFWLGKNYNGLFDIMKIYKIDNKLEVSELLKVCETELGKYYAQKRKEQENLAKARSKRG